MPKLGFHSVVSSVLGLALMLLAPYAIAYDDQRRGFFLSFGGGGQSTSLDFGGIRDIEDTYSTGTGYGAALQLSIGMGITNQFALTGTHQFSRFDVENEKYTILLIGVTGTYWFRPARTSWYVSAMAGRQSLRTRAIREFFGGSATDYVYRAAVGYEFANRMHLEGGLVSGERAEFNNGRSNVDTSSAQVLVSFSWY